MTRTHVEVERKYDVGPTAAGPAARGRAGRGRGRRGRAAPGGDLPRHRRPAPARRRHLAAAPHRRQRRRVAPQAAARRRPRGGAGRRRTRPQVPDLLRALVRSRTGRAAAATGRPAHDRSGPCTACWPPTGPSSPSSPTTGSRGAPARGAELAWREWEVELVDGAARAARRSGEARLLARGRGAVRGRRPRSAGCSATPPPADGQPPWWAQRAGHLRPGDRPAASCTPTSRAGRGAASAATRRCASTSPTRCTRCASPPGGCAARCRPSGPCSTARDRPAARRAALAGRRPRRGPRHRGHARAPARPGRGRGPAELVVGPVPSPARRGARRPLPGGARPGAGRAGELAATSACSTRWTRSSPTRRSCRPRAAGPRKVLPGLVQRSLAAARPRHAARREAAGHERDLLLHEARKDAKRARYAAEAVPSVVRHAPPARTPRTMTRLQEVLGDHQDGVVTREVLRELALAAQDAGESAFTLRPAARPRAVRGRGGGPLARGAPRGVRQRLRRWMASR